MLSLPMDFDLNAALNDYQAYICALEARPTPAASAAPPPQPSNAALTPLLTKQPTTYQDLPTEVIARIGDYVPVQDVMPFATVDRRTYYAMQTRRLVHSYWQRAKQAVTFESINCLLDEMDGTLADPAQHVEPMDALCQRLRALHRADRGDVFKRLFAAAQRIPQDGVQIQKALLLMHRAFTYEREWMELFDFAYALAEQREPGQDNVWPELALGLSNFSLDTPETPTFAQWYYKILARLPSLSVAEQAQIIPTLVRLLNKFNQADPRVIELYTLLHDYALRLPPSHQGASVGALASYVWRFPEAEQSARYAQMRDWALSLPDDQWGVALQRLPEGLGRFSPKRQAQELALLERYLTRVPTVQRTQAAVGLIRSIYFINDTLAKRGWQQGLSLLNGAGEATLWEVLSELRANGVLWHLNNRQWKVAMGEITRFMKANQFSKPAQARIQGSACWLRSRPD
ncbi:MULTISPECIES: hypothetical protein [Burkholderiaceae]|uniref:hypothetical protein n=1 Tax=Burkholderiaceae TaxID=119060 RepID=UPI000978C0DC|nr:MULTISPECIES: hypothetical protein [Burkholderiaceae]MCG1040345.1 hypothetical protein [Mycetohabitans sp. B7]